MVINKARWYSKARHYVAGLIGVATIQVSCNSPDVAVKDVIAPEIEIFEPARDGVFRATDTVFIKGYLSDQNLEKGAVHIHDLFLPAEKDTVFTYEFKVSDVNFLIDTFYVVNDPIDKSYVIYIEGVDRSENFSQKLRYFYQRY